MDKITDLKLQAFALWLAENHLYYSYIYEAWIDKSDKIFCKTTAELTKRYEKDTEEQYQQNDLTDVIFGQDH